MINISMLLDHVKSRLGVSHRHIEFLDDALIKCLEQTTLQTLSVYCPFYCNMIINLNEAEVMPGMNTYFVPETLGDDFNVMGVEYVLPISTGQSASTMFYMPMGGDLQGIITSLAMSKLSNTMLGATVNPQTHQFIAPNMVRLMSTAMTTNAMMIARTTHKKDFTTFPFGMLETIKNLAFYDVAMDIYSVRKYFSNVQTLFAQIQLDMDMYNSIPDKRDELIEKLRTRQLRFSNTKKIFIA